MSDLYEILGVDKNCDSSEIKKAYRQRALENHPDKCGGDVSRAEQFKKVNSAYAILSDSERREKYDKYGVIDENSLNIPPDINEIFSGMFGDFGGMMNNDFLGEIFGMHGRKRGNKPRFPPDEVEIEVDINDIYYGRRRRVIFEILDKCEGCGGCGADDPNAILKCINCDGRGMVHQQLGPVFIQSTCHSCSGKGKILKHNRFCKVCSGRKTVYKKKVYELKIPKGIPDGYQEVRPGKGGYVIDEDCYKDLVYKFKHQIVSPYSLKSNGDVEMNIELELEDLLCGFQKQITLYGEEIVLISDCYFNPSKCVTIKSRGCYNNNTDQHGDLHLKFIIQFSDNIRFSRYLEGFLRILRREKVVVDRQNSTCELIQVN